MIEPIIYIEISQVGLQSQAHGRVQAYDSSWPFPHGGGGKFCVGGIELDRNGNPGHWIRPTFAKGNLAIPAQTMQYADGQSPEILDIIDVPVVEHSPNGHQQENWLLNKDKLWEKISSFPRSRLGEIAETEGSLWHVDGEQSNRVSLEVAKNLNDSIKLIRANDFKIHKSRQERYDDHGKYLGSIIKYRANFDYSNNTYYNLVVTDTNFENDEACAMPPMDNIYLTISLTPPYWNYCWKLVATVIRP